MTDETTEFIQSKNGTLHDGTPEDGAECGSTHSGDWTVLEAPDLETAVMKHNLSPCMFCFEDHSHLIAWKDYVHTDFFEHELAPDPPDDVPERWLDGGETDA